MPSISKHTQIYNDTIRDLLAPAPGRPRPGAGASFGRCGASPASPAAGGCKTITYRDPDPSKDIILVGLEEVKVR